MAIKRKEAPLTPAIPAQTGRPRKLLPEEPTLRLVEGLGRLHATIKECAAFLAVDEKTYLKFRDDFAPVVQAAYDRGAGLGKISLRRSQFRLSDRYPAMAIFLGKNLLGQVDRQEVVGDPTQPVVFQIIRAGEKRSA
jgi:hypothetical protein